MAPTNSRKNYKKNIPGGDLICKNFGVNGSVKTFISCHRTPRPRKGFRRVSEGYQKGSLKGSLKVSEGSLKGFRRVLEGVLG